MINRVPKVEVADPLEVGINYRHSFCVLADSTAIFCMVGVHENDCEYIHPKPHICHS